MLVLSRKTRESVVLGGGGGLERLLKITVLEINGKRVKLGFEVGSDIPVHRMEIREQLLAGGCEVKYSKKEPGLDRRQKRVGEAGSVTGGMLRLVARIAAERKEAKAIFNGHNSEKS